MIQKRLGGCGHVDPTTVDGVDGTDDSKHSVFGLDTSSFTDKMELDEVRCISISSQRNVRCEVLKLIDRVSIFKLVSCLSNLCTPPTSARRGEDFEFRECCVYYGIYETTEETFENEFASKEGQDRPPI